MSTQPGAIKRLWWRWKSMKLPWRKRWLVGFDLGGNTFWEFKDALNAGRVRRIVQYDHKVHLSDVKLAPQWVQWLRHTRQEPPSINEQQLDQIRQAQMKHLAAKADAKWAAKPSLLQKPEPSTLDQESEHQQLPPSHPPEQSTPKDFGHQAKVQEAVGGAAEKLARETPMQRQEDAASRTEAAPTASQEQESRPAKTKEFKGYKLARENEQQPDSWRPTARRR